MFCFRFSSEDDRIKGIKLILKIITNIINHPSQTQKYSNLNSNRIKQKLTKCQPALKLLWLCGFEKSDNNKRLIWTNTNNNMLILRHTKIKLSSMSNTHSSISNINPDNKTISLRSDMQKQTRDYQYNKYNRIKSLLTQQINRYTPNVSHQPSVKKIFHVIYNSC